MTGDAALRGSRVVLVGGGIVGRAIAWRAAEAGAEVTVVDAADTGAASTVAAGMLAPVSEAIAGEDDLLALLLHGAERWPTFAAELAAASGADPGFRPDGTLVVARTTDDVTVLDDVLDLRRSLGLEAQRLSSRACREQEPLLHPRVRGGLLVPADHRADPRQTLAALVLAGERVGVRTHTGRVVAIDADTATAARRVVLDDGEVLPADQVVVTAGSWSGRVAGLPAEVPPPVRPVKGQLLILRDPTGTPPLERTVRGLVHGRTLYLVPRDGGKVVIGATQEERGFDTTLTAGAVRALLDDAAALVPGIDEWELVETLVGLRPGTPDDRPLIGPSGTDGVLLATGHHRHGVLLTPVTADAVVTLLADGEPHPALRAAAPDRFPPP